jgi:hypothetical protein
LHTKDSNQVAKLICAAALAVVLIIISANIIFVHKERERLRMEKGIAESAKIAEEGERERKTA